jgi:hypothetical protein
VLTAKTCDSTGIVNLFPVRDPLMSVGSVVRRSDHFDWHYHFDGERAGGSVRNRAAAEDAIRRCYRRNRLEQVRCAS